MSIYFPVDPDAFIYGAFESVIQRKNNVSGGGWFYLGSDRATYPIMTVGSTSANNHKLEKGGGEIGKYILDASTDVTISGVELLPLNTWIFIGFSRTNDSLGHLYVKPIGGTKEYIQSTDTAGTWLSDEITAVVFGHADLNLVGGVTQFIDDCYMQDFFFADNTVLTEAQFDLLAALDDPRSIPGVTHHWLDETGDLAGALVDNVGNCPLAIYDRLTATEGEPTANPPVWNALALTLNAFDGPASLTSPTATAETTTISPSVNTDEAEGTIYAGVFAQGTTITDGQDIIDELTTQVDSLGSGIVTKLPTATGTNALPQITGLTSNTAYVVWFTQIDSDTNISTPVSYGITTAQANTVSATIVIDNAQTLHGDNASVSWELTEGTKSSEQTFVASGDNASIINGVLTIDVPTRYAGDKLVLSADISTTDIHGTNTEHFRGAVVVEGTAAPTTQQTVYLDFGVANTAKFIEVTDGTFTVSTAIELQTPNTASYAISNICKVTSGNLEILSGTITDVSIDSVLQGTTTPAMPTDGEFHTIGLVGSGTLTHIGSPDGTTEFYSGGIKKFTVDGDEYSLDQYSLNYQNEDDTALVSILPTAESTFDDLTNWSVSGDATLSSAGAAFITTGDRLILDASYDTDLPTDCYMKIGFNFKDRVGGTYNQLKIHDRLFTGTAYYSANSDGIHNIYLQNTEGAGFGIYYATDTGNGGVDDIYLSRYTTPIIFNNIVYLDYKETGEPTVPGTALTFPRIGGMNIGAHDMDNAVKRATIAKYDLSILGMYRDWARNGWTMTSVLSDLRNQNPDIILGKYTMPMQVISNTSDTATADLRAKVDAEGWWVLDEPSDAYVTSQDGNSYLVNVTDWTVVDSNGDRFPQYKAKRDNTEFFAPDNWDIWYFDNVFFKPRVDNADWDIDGTNDLGDDATIMPAYRDGIADNIIKAQELQPTMKFMGNTSDYSPANDFVMEAAEYTGLMDGGFIEHLITDDRAPAGKSEVSIEYWHGFTTALAVYDSAIAHAKNTENVYALVGVSSDMAPEYCTLAIMRYGLTTTLLRDGYFHFGSYASPQYFDEYSLNLGEEVDTPPSAANADGLWVREFQYGISICNPKGNGAVLIDFANDFPGFTRFDASRLPFEGQDITRNNGSTTNFSLPERDGVILVTTDYPFYED